MNPDPDVSSFSIKILLSQSTKSTEVNLINGPSPTFGTFTPTRAPLIIVAEILTLGPSCIRKAISFVLAFNITA